VSQKREGKNFGDISRSGKCPTLFSPERARADWIGLLGDIAVEPGRWNMAGYSECAGLTDVRT